MRTAHTMKVAVFLSLMLGLMGHHRALLRVVTVCEALSASSSSFATRHDQRMEQLRKLQNQIGSPPPPPAPSSPASSRRKTREAVATNHPQFLHHEVTSLKMTVADLAKIVSSLSMDMKTVVQQQATSRKRQEQRDAERKVWRTNFSQLLEKQTKATNDLGSTVTELKVMQQEQGTVLKSLSKSHLAMAKVVSSVRDDVEDIKTQVKKSQRHHKKLEQRLIALEQKVDKKASSSVQQKQRPSKSQKQKRQQQQQQQQGVQLFESITYPPTRANKVKRRQYVTEPVSVTVSSSRSSWSNRKFK